MIASIAVEPFLYAALFIEMAVLLSIPMLTSIHKPPGKGVVRFLIYQTLAMPFILLAGWLLAGVEASPGDLALAAQSASMLGLGFAFLLAIFPLYNWIPMLAEEASPFAIGFLLWILPTTTLFFGMGFLDRYSWLRSSPQLAVALQSAGLLMVVTGGIWAAFQRHLGRIMAYGSVVETGLSLIALSLDSRVGHPNIVFAHPGACTWAGSLVTFIKRDQRSCTIHAVRRSTRDITKRSDCQHRLDSCVTFHECISFTGWLSSALGVMGWTFTRFIERSILAGHRHGWITGQFFSFDGCIGHG